jgi:hypothetical protein
LLRAINDVVLSFPDLRNLRTDVAVPLRLLAQFWMAYYWPFVKPSEPILQGQRAILNGQLRNDMSFRPQLERLRREWESIVGGISSPSDGFFLINDRTYTTGTVRSQYYSIYVLCKSRVPRGHG